MKLTLSLLAAVALLSPCVAQTTSAPLTTKTHPEEGEYLVAGNGFTVYMFKADMQGVGEEARSSCEGDCLAAWPPVLVDGAPVGDGNIRADLLGTMTRGDGTVQVTYNGWPLYYYAEDYTPEDINGSDIEDFGEDWYLIGPNGNRSDRDDREDRDDRGRRRGGDDD